MRDFYPCRFHQLRVKSHLFSGVVKRVHKAGRGKRGLQSAFLQHDEQSTQRDWSVSGAVRRANVHSAFGTQNTCTVRFETVIAMPLKTKVLRVVLPRRLEKSDWHPKDVFCLHFQVQVVQEASSSHLSNILNVLIFC